MKICNKCGESRPREVFHKDKYRKDGRSNTCSYCRKGIKVIQNNNEVSLSLQEQWLAKNTPKKY